MHYIVANQNETFFVVGKKLFEGVFQRRPSPFNWAFDVFLLKNKFVRSRVKWTKFHKRGCHKFYTARKPLSKFSETKKGSGGSAKN